jgi:hypothetical protein
MVDALTDPGGLVTLAVNWLEELLALPSGPMLATRRMARADIIQALDGFTQAELDRFLDGWNSADSQAALRDLMQRLKK